MRYPPDHRAKTRERILAAAATVFRRQGFQAASVDTIMAEAGLTAGGFYAHFKSKEDLFAAAFRHALDQASLLKSVVRMAAPPTDGSTPDAGNPQAGTDQLRAMAGRYLSLAHRRMIDHGCPLPPLLADLPRQDAATRQEFQAVLKQTAAGLQSQLPDTSGDAAERPLALLALLVGGLTLSRAVEDDRTAEHILAACRALVDTALQPTAGTPTSTNQPAVRKRPRKPASSQKPRKYVSPRS